MPNAHRVIVIDDNPDIHDDFRKILKRGDNEAAKSALAALESSLFDAPAVSPSDSTTFEIDTATQGAEGADKVEAAIREGRNYSIAFVDMRMPPGWDGVQTAREIIKRDPNIRIVICTAYSEYTPKDIAHSLTLQPGQLSFRRKPFDPTEMSRFASTLAASMPARGE